MHYVIVPGINGSGRDHWQTHWQDVWGPAATRIGPSSWDAPDLADWHRALDRATRRHGPSAVVLLAHSLGCLAAASWLAARAGRAGHINAASGLGAWAAGQRLLGAFTAGLG